MFIEFQPLETFFFFFFFHPLPPPPPLSPDHHYFSKRSRRRLGARPPVCLEFFARPTRSPRRNSCPSRPVSASFLSGATIVSKKRLSFVVPSLKISRLSLKKKKEKKKGVEGFRRGKRRKEYKESMNRWTWNRERKKYIWTILCPVPLPRDQRDSYLVLDKLLSLHGPTFHPQNVW